MAQAWMITAPRDKVKKRELEIMIEKNDCKKWVIGRERGKGGYEHWQIRVESSNEEFFEWCRAYIPSAHVEQAEHGVDECLYEQKEGKHVSYADRPQTLQQRYGKLTDVQKRVVKALQGTNDREVMVWYDQQGKVGKSWLCGALWERGLAYYTPPTVDTVKGMIQWVASCYTSGGYRPYIIIDIPRSWKWSTQLYTAIESIKDGLVYDTRYRAQLTNIRGVKVLVLTNTLPKLDKLSNDRWRILGRGGRPLT